MSTGVGTTLSSVGSSLLVALATLLYWQVKARAARARTEALRQEVRQAVGSATPSEGDSKVPSSGPNARSDGASA